MMNIVYSNHRSEPPIIWECEGCGDDKRDGYKLAMKQFQTTLDEHARRAREKAIVYVCEQIGLMAKLRESMNGKGDPGITILELVKEHFEELKSQPQ